MSAVVTTTAEMAHRESLPSLVERAGRRLLDARSSAEVLEAKRLAEAALHYAKVTKAANETHADCLRIITRAEMRMADEIDRGQANGEVTRHGGDRSKPQSAGLEELGVSSQRVSEWRDVRDAGHSIVEQAIQTALAEGRSPTKADIVNHVRGTFGTGENEWYTPHQYLAAARDVLGAIDIDPASSDEAQKLVKATRYFTMDNDGLNQVWAGRIWLNPPYSQPMIRKFVSKMVDELAAGNIYAAIMLTHNYTDTAWFHAAAQNAQAICFTRGRVRFIDAEGNVAAPTQGQAFFYFGPSVESFTERFSFFGFVVKPWRASNAA